VPNIRRYGVQHFPTMWLVDRQGIIRDVTGMVALNDKVARLINENNAPTPTKHNPVAAPAPSARPEPTTSPAPAPPPRPQPSKLGDHPVSVKNITITAKRSTALLQVGPTTYTVSTGTELVFPSGTEKIVARCIAIERSAVVLAVDGQTDPVRLVLP
jgi:hypothetical protein